MRCYRAAFAQLLAPARGTDPLGWRQAGGSSGAAARGGDFCIKQPLAARCLQGWHGPRRALTKPGESGPSLLGDPRVSASRGGFLLLSVGAFG